jgi:glycosyltransferase involved in cell wall biosynthesis
MITQRVDRTHDVLGFTTRWITEIASHVDSLIVLTGYAGEYDLPENVSVYSYGKERGFSKPRRVLRFERLVASIALSNRVDVVFAHMIPDYVNASFPWLKLRGIPYVLWFAHGATNRKIRLAYRLSTHIVTSTDAAFNLSDEKVIRVGQGIDMDEFQPGEQSTSRSELLSLGRIDRVKNFDIAIEAVGQLVAEGRDVHMRLVGEPMRADDSYLEELAMQTMEHGIGDHIEFVGSIPHTRVVEEYQRASVFVNPSQTGSLDKTEVEAMACGTPVISCNTSYRDFVQEIELNERLTFEKPDPTALADRLRWILDANDRTYAHLSEQSREAVRTRHSLENQMERIADVFESVSKNR